MNKAFLAALAGALLVSPFTVRASSTTVWEMNSYRDFLAGRLNGLSLTRDGRMLPAPKTDTLFASGQPIVWNVVQASDGTLYAATGHRGRIYRIDRSGKSSLLWTADQPEIFALALDSKGVLYAGTSPDGKIYRIENGKASEYFSPGTKYIWSLAFSRDGALYAGTGDEGRIFRISAAGKGEVWYETGQAHVTCLAFDSDGRLLAGSEPNGILYRVYAKDKAFVLYDANLPEIRTIVPGPGGAIYAAALGGSMTRRSLGGVNSAIGVPSSASVSATSTTVTVEAQAGVELKPKAESAKGQAQSQVTPVQIPQIVDLGSTEKSAIYRINPDNTVESLWSSKEENVYDLLLTGGQITFSTDEHGRIYRLTPDRQATLLVETGEGEAVRLLSTSTGLLAATGDMGNIYRLASEQSPAGTYESPVHDASTVARWGRLNWLGELPQGGHIVFRTRSGNSMRPDQTWSDWSEPLADSGSPVRSPNARYIQWKAEFTGTGPAGPALDSVSLAYLPQNTPPSVKSVTVVSQPGTAQAQKASATPAQASSAYSITVTDTGDAGASTSSGTATQTPDRSASDQLQIVWQADDPDGDRMTYSVYFRGEGEREWKLLKANISENTYAIDADSLADGRYWFRVVGSDSPANAPGSARNAEMVSSPTLIDHTPPVVTASAPRRTGSRVEIDVDAADAASSLRRAEYSVDAAPWVPIDPAEGIIDSQRERFIVRLDNVAPGEHLVVFRATDSAGNAGLAKVIVK